MSTRVAPASYVAQPPAERRGYHLVPSAFFSVLIVYYWFLQFTSSDQAFLIEEQYAYGMFVGPTSAFAVLGLIYTFEIGRAHV